MFSFIMDIWPFSLLFYKKLPPPTPIIPEFVPPEQLISGEFHYNPDFYVTEATAKAIMERFNAMVMFEKAVKNGEGLAPPQWFIRFHDGLEINVGELARFFALYPEKKFKNIALRYG